MCSLNGLLAFNDENYRWLLCNRTYHSCHIGMLSNFVWICLDDDGDIMTMMMMMMMMMMMIDRSLCSMPVL